MDEIPHAVPQVKSRPHYYGDVVRGLFLGAAIVMLVAGFATPTLPIPSGLAIVWIVMLVLIAGLTNPIQRGVQWLNVIVSVIGLLVFGGNALSQYRSFGAAFTTGILIMLLALLFLLSLYFSTKTLRGVLIDHPFELPPQR